MRCDLVTNLLDYSFAMERPNFVVKRTVGGVLALLACMILTACGGAAATPTATAVVSAAPLTFKSSPLTTHPDGLDLVFQGGGAKGLAHIGAIRELEQQGRPYRRVVGTSAGSIVTVLLAAGFSADSMQTAITKRTPAGHIIMGSFLVPSESSEFDEELLQNSITYLALQDVIPEFVPETAAEQIESGALERVLESVYYREIFALVETGGFYSGAAFVEWLRETPNRDGRSLGDATLAEFHATTGVDMTIVATDATENVMLALNHRTAPNLPVVWAVRMSSSIPIVFREVEWRPEWGPYLGRNISGHFVVDGGMATNLPLELVLLEEPTIENAMVIEPAPDRVSGVVLDHERFVPGLEATPTPSTPADIDKQENQRIVNRWIEIRNRIVNLVDTLLNAHDHLVAKSYPDQVWYLPVSGVETLEYDMSDAKIDRLLDAAEAAMQTCLENLDE